MSKKSIKDYFDVAQLESVDRLGKPPSKEQQLSRTQHFTLKAHAAIRYEFYSTKRLAVNNQKHKLALCLSYPKSAFISEQPAGGAGR